MREVKLISQSDILWIVTVHPLKNWD